MIFKLIVTLKINKKKYNVSFSLYGHEYFILEKKKSCIGTGSCCIRLNDLYYFFRSPEKNKNYHIQSLLLCLNGKNICALIKLNLKVSISRHCFPIDIIVYNKVDMNFMNKSLIFLKKKNMKPNPWRDNKDIFKNFIFGKLGEYISGFDVYAAFFFSEPCYSFLKNRVFFLSFWG